jgi:hypothetical protein
MLAKGNLIISATPSAIFSVFLVKIDKKFDYTCRLSLCSCRLVVIVVNFEIFAKACEYLFVVAANLRETVNTFWYVFELELKVLHEFESVQLVAAIAQAN